MFTRRPTADLPAQESKFWSKIIDLMLQKRHYDDSSALTLVKMILPTHLLYLVRSSPYHTVSELGIRAVISMAHLHPLLS